MVKRKKLITLILQLFIFWGCSNSGNFTTEIDINEEAYILHTTYSKRVSTQFGLYYFLPNESRNIMAYGWFPQSEEETFTSIYCSGSGISSLTSQIGNGPNMYKNTAGSGFEFVVPVTVTAPLIWSNYDAEVRGTGTTGYFTIKVGEKREFNELYSCMSSYNLYDNGYEFSERVDAAFDEAKTNLFLVPQNTNLTNENVPWHIVESIWVDQLYAFFYQRGVIPEHPLQNKAYLIGCKSTNGGSNLLLGFTFMRSTEPNKHKITIILVENILNRFTDPTLGQKYVTWCAIHELGHARGMNFTANQGYFDGDITNAEHTGGHNGTNIKYCVMRFRNNPNDLDFTEERFLKGLNDPKFCYGHLQMLHNADWW